MLVRPEHFTVERGNGMRLLDQGTLKGGNPAKHIFFKSLAERMRGCLLPDAKFGAQPCLQVLNPHSDARLNLRGQGLFDQVNGAFQSLYLLQALSLESLKILA
jgi:hypothetical protein